MVALPYSSLPLSLGQSTTRRRVAVVLNVNAHKVDDETLAWMRAVVPRQDLFVSKALDEGQRIADEIVRRGYEAVMWGGGDGTFSQGVAALVAASVRRGVDLPEVGVLRLGTGNAVAYTVGAGPATPRGVMDDLRRARKAKAARTLQLLKVEERPTVFAGFGLDAQILDDFRKTVDGLRKARLADAISSAGARYFLSIATRSLPRFVLSERVEVVAVNRGSPAVKLNVRGERMGDPIPQGRVLWRGMASLAAASTIPYYGLGLKMFPHADKEPGRFQLRLSDAPAAEILAGLPLIWHGRYASPRLHDFLVDRVELVVARPSPFQSGGDLVGDRGRVTISLWDRPIAVV
ncbi:MAG: hypothetical protein HY698_10710 [Deltaproteobacteria bacterium]|nr:hypothetical protein [Deltaproteobacteria bacterium]